MEKIRYTAIIESTSTGYSAYLPDVPGCVSTGQTQQEVIRNLAEALHFHLEALQEQGDAIPMPRTYSHDVSPDDAVPV